MLTLKCQIEIRSKSTKKTVRFDYANSIEVKTSCNSLTDTAVLKLPRKMSWRGKPLTDYVRRNDGITIRAGYAEHGLETLFQGYVKDVENGRPVEITCENEMRRLKGITVEPEIIPNFDIRAFMFLCCEKTKGVKPTLLLIVLIYFLIFAALNHQL